MGAPQNFALPDLPPVCLSCGGRGPLSHRTVVYTCTSGNLGTAVALLFGAIYYETTTYRLTLPLCAPCGDSGRRKTLVMVLMWPVVIGLFALTFAYGLDYPALFALPVAFTIAGLVYAAVLQSRSRPKAVRVGEGQLVINVPGHGRLALVGHDPRPQAPQARASAPQRPAKAAPQLNRSVCHACGFINFAHAAECKKCREPLARHAAVAV